MVAPEARRPNLNIYFLAYARARDKIRKPARNHSSRVIMPLLTNDGDRRRHADECSAGGIDEAVQQNTTTGALRSSMTYKQLGSSGLKVSQVVLGCMGFGSPKWQKWVLPEETYVGFGIRSRLVSFSSADTRGRTGRYRC